MYIFLHIKRINLVNMFSGGPQAQTCTIAESCTRVAIVCKMPRIATAETMLFKYHLWVFSISIQLQSKAVYHHNLTQTK